MAWLAMTWRSTMFRAMTIETLVAGLLIMVCVGLRIADPSAVARLRTSAFDTFVKASPRVADGTFPVRVVAVDEPSLAAIGQWPWPRTRLADLAKALSSAGARSVTFDIMLVEPDRLSPGELAHSLRSDASLQPLMTELAKLPSNDTRLAAAIGRAPVILGIVGDANGRRDIGASLARFSFAGDDPQRFVPAFEAGITNLAELSKAATGVGAVNWLPTEDQIVRRAPLLVSIAGQLYPSLALETLRVAAGQSTIFVKSSGGSGLSAFGQSTGIESLRVGSTIVPTDAQGEMWLRPAPSDPRRTISAQRILDGTFDRADISGRHIMIGATAAGLLDLRATALAPSVPGVEIHAQALEQILAADHLLRPAYATGLELIFIVVFGGVVMWLIRRAGAMRAALVGAGAIGAVIAISWFAYAHAGLLFDPVYPSLSLAVFYLGTSLTTYVRSEADRARIRSAFSHYLAPSLVAELVRNHDKLKLGGETRIVTLLFADVRGFSRISERMAAEYLIRFVNRLFTPLTETILRNGGTIDKFMGDAVMAFWNAPTDDPDHARKACRTALQMLDDVVRLNAELVAEAEAAGSTHEPIRIGIGINTGSCVVGNVGSPERFDYSVLGDVVNVAARFEEATKTAGADIIIGEATASAVADFDLRDAGNVTLRSKDRPEKIFALLGDEASVRIFKVAAAPANPRGADVAG